MKRKFFFSLVFISIFGCDEVIHSGQDTRRHLEDGFRERGKDKREPEGVFKAEKIAMAIASTI